MDKIHVSPRILCPCGKTIMHLSPDQRREYDDAMLRLAESRHNDECGDNADQAVSAQPLMRVGMQHDMTNH